MRKISLIAIFALIIISVVNHAEADQPLPHAITLRDGQGLTQAMVGAGCNMYWLSDLMQANHVSAAMLRQLPRGAMYQTPANCMAQPPEAVRRASRNIMAQDLAAARKEAVPVVPQSAAVIPDSKPPTSPQPQRFTATRSNSDGPTVSSSPSPSSPDLIDVTFTRAQWDKLNAIAKAYGPLQEKAHNLESLMTSFRWSVAILVLMLFAVMAFSIQQRTSLKKAHNRIADLQKAVALANMSAGWVRFPEKLTVEQGGMPFTFAWSSGGFDPNHAALVASYQCPLCPERNLMVHAKAGGWHCGSLIKHLNRRHGPGASADKFERNAQGISADSLNAR